MLQVLIRSSLSRWPPRTRAVLPALLPSPPLRSYSTKLDHKLVLDWKIRARRVMLIDEEGKKIGEVDLPVAIAQAKEKKMQVMLVSNKDPQLPICKIYNIGKYKYQQQQKAKKSSSETKTKEIRFSAKIEENDVHNKVATAQKFLIRKNTVVITIVFDKPPDMELAGAMMDNIYSRVESFTRRDANLRVSNRYVSCSFYPIIERVNEILANPDKTPEQLADEAAERAAKKAAKEAAKEAKMSSGGATDAAPKTSKSSEAEAKKGEGSAKSGTKSDAEIAKSGTKKDAETAKSGTKNDMTTAKVAAGATKGEDGSPKAADDADEGDDEADDEEGDEEGDEDDEVDNADVIEVDFSEDLKKAKELDLEFEREAAIAMREAQNKHSAPTDNGPISNNKNFSKNFQPPRNQPHDARNQSFNAPPSSVPRNRPFNAQPNQAFNASPNQAFNPPPKRAFNAPPNQSFNASPNQAFRNQSPNAPPPHIPQNQPLNASPPRATQNQSFNAPPPRAHNQPPNAPPPRTTQNQPPNVSPPRTTQNQPPNASPPRTTQNFPPPNAPAQKSNLNDTDNLLNILGQIQQQQSSHPPPQNTHSQSFTPPQNNRPQNQAQNAQSGRPSQSYNQSFPNQNQPNNQFYNSTQQNQFSRSQNPQNQSYNNNSFSKPQNQFDRNPNQFGSSPNQEQNSPNQANFTKTPNFQPKFQHAPRNSQARGGQGNNPWDLRQESIASLDNSENGNFDSDFSREVSDNRRGRK